MARKIVLASASAARTRLLMDAGVPHIAEPADVDETAIQNDWCGPPADLARQLAEAKALSVAENHPGAWVIGADQVLALGEKILTKPGTAANVRGQLRMLRGKQHSLLSSVCVVQDAKVLWSHTDQADLHMRAFSDAFLDEYVASVGEQVASSVGGYHLEGLGAQLFERIDGDYFTVLGLPLISLLEFLRTQGAVKS